MERTIVRDIFLLGRKALTATEADIQTGRDLRDTLRANRDRCVGMAANMIGVNKRIIVVSIGEGELVMYNPVITASDRPYETEEGCLSLDGVRKTTRYQTIRVEYQDEKMRPQRRQFTGWIAQIIQHEIDHTNGIII